MIVKKLAVPLINEKILQQAVHVYIATSSISEAGFDFLRSRIPPKTKIDIVTGLTELTEPSVLRRVITNYQGRIALNIYTRNVLHANLYVFELPFRKSIAFVGSGNFSIEGFKDHEELFWKVIDAKEVEFLMSWYTSYFQFSVPLSEEIVRDYELRYERMKLREIRSAREMQELLELTAGSFQWDSVRFRNQYFLKEEFTLFGADTAPYENASIRIRRVALQEKLRDLTRQVKTILKLRLDNIKEDSIDPGDHIDKSIDRMGFTLREGNLAGTFFRVEIGLLNVSVNVTLPSKDESGKRYRFHEVIDDDPSRKEFFEALVDIGKEFQMEVAGKSRAINSFQKPESLQEFAAADRQKYFPLIIKRLFPPGDPALASDKIVAALADVLGKLKAILDKL